MTRRPWIVLAAPALMTVTACSKPAPDMTGKSARPAVTAAAGAATAPGSGSATGPGSDGAKAMLVPQLAYDYSYRFTASAADTGALLKADRAACDTAGVTRCQMVSLTADADAAAGYSDKTLELRVAPDWLKAWQEGLETRLNQAHARMQDQKVASEDLSLQVVDTEAHLKNKEALRDRMADIVRTGQGKLSDLIDVETQLSQVQADIDATKSSLAVMNARIDTVHVTLTYRSDAGPAAGSVFAPVTDAAKSSLGVFMHVVGLLVTLAAVLLPVAIVTVPTVWYFRRRRPVAGEPGAS